MQTTVFILILIAMSIAIVNAKEKCGPNEELHDCMPYRSICNLQARGRLPICLRGCTCKKGYKEASFDDKTCVPIGPSCK